MDVPNNDPKTKIVYIRDFLEKLPEIKTYDETATVLKTLPNVIQHQLKFDHEQVGKDILDAVFRWENDFDQPILDEYRKNNLCSILNTKTQDVTVKIPLILFFSNILSNTLPRIMIKEKMVISYLKCLTQIEDESASTEQAAMYAIHNLVGSLEGFQFSETVQASI